MRDFYRDTDLIANDRAVVLLRYSDFAAPHDTMSEALREDLRAWLDENIHHDFQWDVWDSILVERTAQFQPPEGTPSLHHLDSYWFVLQFESEAEAAIFKLRWNVIASRPKVVSPA